MIQDRKYTPITHLSFVIIKSNFGQDNKPKMIPAVKCFMTYSI